MGDRVRCLIPLDDLRYYVLWATRGPLKICYLQQAIPLAGVLGMILWVVAWYVRAELL